ncbi:MAG TPA: tRNA (adenosine(37)-N6)-threonylcarbamoyltransferase complex dimerization subunit type 1 TsaB [Desulfobacteria bacterium]|nr:tRNA (adenosine(37)-N6)-threonylcarbamoyltransferase complex dimerization subunit type 1 TsaB [Desulfobacteria bacterium]
MWVLSIDTATKVTGLAIHRDTELVAEAFLHTGTNHSERIVPMIHQLLANAQIKFADLDAVAVASGPGSFTGLRIGMATAKGIAQVRGIKLVGINTLDGIAQNGLGFDGLVAPILDARKNEVYTALYRSSGHEISRIADYEAVAPQTMLEKLKAQEEKVLFLGDAVFIYRKSIEEMLKEQAVFLPDRMCLPRAAQIGALAVERLARGESDNLFNLTPFYIRQSEAEVTWAKRFG